jgi:hypothetical protein
VREAVVDLPDRLADLAPARRGAALDPKDLLLRPTEARRHYLQATALALLESNALNGGDVLETGVPDNYPIGMATCLAGNGRLLDSVTLLGPALAPLSCPLTTQQLVDLLKQPLCVGHMRRVILNKLEDRFRRKFADQWDFVRFTEKRRLGLNFTSTPLRTLRPLRTATK